MHGKGTLVHRGGDKFIGDLVNGKKHGEGEMIYKNGHRYRGKWVNGRAHGFGILR
jgi:hypothetical protein